MNIQKAYQDFITKKFTDLHLILIDNNQIIELDVHKCILIYTCDYFYNSLSFKDRSSLELKVDDAQVAQDIIKEFYEIEAINAYCPKNLYKLKKIKIKNFFCLPTPIDDIIDIKIEPEYFEYLLEILDLFDRNENFYKICSIIRNNLPSNYDINSFDHRTIQAINRTSLIALSGEYNTTIYDFLSGIRVGKIPYDSHDGTGSMKFSHDNTKFAINVRSSEYHQNYEIFETVNWKKETFFVVSYFLDFDINNHDYIYSFEFDDGIFRVKLDNNHCNLLVNFESNNPINDNFILSPKQNYIAILKKKVIDIITFPKNHYELGTAFPKIEKICSIQCPFTYDYVPLLISFSPDEKLIAFIESTLDCDDLIPEDYNVTIYVYNLETASISTYNGYGGAVESIRISPCNTKIAISGSIGIVIWDLLNNNILKKIDIDCDFLEADFSICGQYIVYHYRKTVCVIDAETFELVNEFNNHEHIVHMAISR